MTPDMVCSPSSIAGAAKLIAVDVFSVKSEILVPPISIEATLSRLMPVNVVVVPEVIRSAPEVIRADELTVTLFAP